MSNMNAPSALSSAGVQSPPEVSSGQIWRSIGGTLTVGIIGTLPGLHGITFVAFEVIDDGFHIRQAGETSTVPLESFLARFDLLKDAFIRTSSVCPTCNGTKEVPGALGVGIMWPCRDCSEEEKK